MGLEFIPNQPVKFVDDSQSRLNNDNKAWDILLQESDPLCVQIKMTPCGDNLLPLFGCTDDVAKYDQTLNTNTDWTEGTGWTVGSATATHTGGVQADLRGVTTPLTVGKVYKLVFTIDSNNDYLSVYLGATDPLFSYYFTDTGEKTIYFTYNGGGNQLVFTATNDVVFSNISICLYSAEFESITGWSYDGSLKWFCHGLRTTDPILSLNNFFFASSYYQIKFKVYNRTAGSVFMKSSTNGVDDLGSTESVTSNGDFTLYIQNDSGGDGKICITPSSDFDGCISDIEIYDLTPIQTGSFAIKNSTGTSVSNGYDITSAINPIICYKDRLSWCVSFDNVTYLLGQIALPTGCYYIEFTEYCGGGSTTTQVNRINYSSSGFEKTKYISATCEGEAFGFEFTNSSFSLGQRLPVFRINPKYSNDGDDYSLPSGSKRKPYVRTEKTKLLWVDFIDENAHDTLRLQVNCDTFMMDGVEYFVPINDYDPLWEANGKSNTAQIQIEIQDKINTLYNR